MFDSWYPRYSFEEFEHITKECNDVFKTWEDEDEKFRTMLREIQKKRADSTVRAMRRTPTEHKGLQDRLNHLGMPQTRAR
jgi:hypothetical protein